MTETKLESCVVRIESPDGQTIGGTGFVVTPDLAVTCTHVVEACGTGPGERVRLVFHADGTPAEAEVSADAWHPAADVAFVRLSVPLPEGTTPAAMTTSIGREGIRLRALGYPDTGKIEGVWGTGELVDRVKGAGHEWVQIESTQITRGFSGGPVWDAATGHVVGMVSDIAVPDAYRRLGNMAFAVPAETLCNLCPEPLAILSAQALRVCQIMDCVDKARHILDDGLPVTRELSELAHTALNQALDLLHELTVVARDDGNYDRAVLLSNLSHEVSSVRVGLKSIGDRRYGRTIRSDLERLEDASRRLRVIHKALEDLVD